MRRDDTLMPVLEQISLKDPRYQIDGYLFLLSALHFTQSQLRTPPRHVSGAELLEGIRLYGLSQFGPLTRTVLEHWGIYDTLDIGRIVFNLADHSILRQTEQDSLEDFRGIYDFREVFDEGWKASLRRPIEDPLAK